MGLGFLHDLLSNDDFHHLYRRHNDFIGGDVAYWDPQSCYDGDYHHGVNVDHLPGAVCVLVAAFYSFTSYTQKNLL